MDSSLLTPTLPEKVLQEAYSRLALPPQYYSRFQAKAQQLYAEMQQDCPDDETATAEDSNVASSLHWAGQIVSVYAAEIGKGHSPLWAETYADMASYGEREEVIVPDVLRTLPDKEAQQRELVIHAKSLCDDPVFVERYCHLVHVRADNPREEAFEYTQCYHSLLSQGHTAVYASAFGEALNDGFQPEFAAVFAEAYALAHEHGFSHSQAYCWASDCMEAADTGYWACLEQFRRSHSERWQLDFYQHLMDEDEKACEALERKRALHERFRPPYEDAADYEL